MRSRRTEEMAEEFEIKRLVFGQTDPTVYIPYGKKGAGMRYVAPPKVAPAKAPKVLAPITVEEEVEGESEEEEANIESLVKLQEEGVEVPIRPEDEAEEVGEMAPEIVAGYLGWYDDEKKKSLDEKVKEAVERFAGKYGEGPGIVLISLDEGEGEAERLAEKLAIRVEGRKHLRKNNLWVGGEKFT
jgi:hypothetical protein